MSTPFSSRKLIAAAVLAATGALAFAQTPPAGAPAPQQGRAEMHAHRGAGMDPAKRAETMQLRMERRLAALKLKLQISAAQEGAWNAWTTAMKPAQRQRPDHSEFERMTTPERIDRMKQMRTQRAAEADRRGDATKTFYAALSADQKKVFDDVSTHMGRGRGGHGGGGMRHHGGPGRG
jgi:protein CpxP